MYNKHIWGFRFSSSIKYKRAPVHEVYMRFHTGRSSGFPDIHQPSRFNSKQWL